MKKTQKIMFILLTLLLINGCTSLIFDMIKKEFSLVDSNKDGLISYKEFKVDALKDKEEVDQKAKKSTLSTNEYLKRQFDETDINKDGKITLKEAIIFVENPKER